MKKILIASFVMVLCAVSKAFAVWAPETIVNQGSDQSDARQGPGTPDTLEKDHRRMEHVLRSLEDDEKTLKQLVETLSKEKK